MTAEERARELAELITADGDYPLSQDMIESYICDEIKDYHMEQYERKKIAAMAMQGLLSNSPNGMIQKLNEVGDILGGYEQAVAKAATSSADALLKELEQ